MGVGLLGHAYINIYILPIVNYIITTSWLINHVHCIK